MVAKLTPSFKSASLPVLSKILILGLFILLITGYGYHRTALSNMAELQKELSALQKDNDQLEDTIAQLAEENKELKNTIFQNEIQNIAQEDLIDFSKAGIDSALVRASADGNPELVKLFLRLGANVDARPQNGLTPLTSAAMHGHIDVVKVLIDNHADPFVKADRMGSEETALMIAAQRKNTDIVELLTEYQALYRKRNVPVE